MLLGGAGHWEVMGEKGDLRDCSNGHAPIERAVEIALWKGTAEYLYSSLFPGVQAAQIVCLDSSYFCDVLILNKIYFISCFQL